MISNYDSDLLTLDPVNGDVEVDFMYTTTDAAGIESEPATVVMPFFTISLSGNVYHDADGLTDGIVDGTVICNFVRRRRKCCGKCSSDGRW